MRELTYADAGIEAVAEEMRRDPKIFYMSTDPIPPLFEEFGPKRIRATPIAEAALTGMAIGAAGSGLRPIVDWRQVTFAFVAMDQIVNQAAKIHYMFGGQQTFPILFRAAVGGGTRLAAQHGLALMGLTIESHGQHLCRRLQLRQTLDGRRRLARFRRGGTERGDPIQRGERPQRGRLQGRGGQGHLLPPSAETDLGPGHGDVERPARRTR